MLNLGLYNISGSLWILFSFYATENVQFGRNVSLLYRANSLFVRRIKASKLSSYFFLHKQISLFLYITIIYNLASKLIFIVRLQMSYKIKVSLFMDYPKPHSWIKKWPGQKPMICLFWMEGIRFVFLTDILLEVFSQT